MELTLDNLLEILKKTSSMEDIGDEFSVNENIVDQGVDSLDMLDFYLNIEEEFNVQIPDKDIDKLKSINDVFDYLKNKL